MFGTTPRLDVGSVSHTLFSNLGKSMEIIQAWLGGYIRVTEVKDRTGDRAYRESCLSWARQLLKVVNAMTIIPGQSFSDLQKSQQALINKFYGFVETFLSSTTFPVKPRSKLNQSVQEVLVSCKLWPAVERYESIYFLEDLEALSIVFKGFFLSRAGEEDRLMLVPAQREAVNLPLKKLGSIPALKPLLADYILPLARIALNLSSERLDRLKELHLAIPGELSSPQNRTAFTCLLFPFFQALQKDLASEDRNALISTKALFRNWRAQTLSEDLRDVFDETFRARADDLLRIIGDTLCDPITKRVSQLLNQTANVPKSARRDLDFLFQFSQLISQYDLDLNIKAVFITGLFQVHFQPILFSDSTSDVKRYIVRFLERLSLSEAELTSLCHKAEPLTKQDQCAILAMVYLEAYQILLTREPDLLESFLLVKNTLLASALKRIEADRLSFLFQDLVPSIVNEMQSLRRDGYFMLQLQERYQFFGVTFPFQHDRLVLPMSQIINKPSAESNPAGEANFFKAAPKEGAQIGADSQVAKEGADPDQEDYALYLELRV